jgi:hypothetical protein
MTFSTGEVTPRLIDGEVILWAGEMDSGDQPEEAMVCLFKGGFTGKGLSLFDFNKTTPLGIPLLNQIAFHYKILSQGIFRLQVEMAL